MQFSITLIAFYLLETLQQGLNDINMKILNKLKGNGSGSYTVETSQLLQNIVSLPNTSGDLNNKSELQEDLPTSIEVQPDSTLYAEDEQPAEIHFKVTNNRQYPTYYVFEASSQDAAVYEVNPRRSSISPKSRLSVRVTVPLTTEKGRTNLITFSAMWSTLWSERVTKKVYIQSRRQSSDTTKPSISYTYSGDCSDSLHPDICRNKVWRADITIQDTESGLLLIKSEPVGLTLNNEFIVGTKEEVSGFYRAYCCQTKADIIAKDIYGNERTLNIDIEKIWLSTAEIIAIVFGCLLLLILIICIIIAIVVCLKRRNKSTLNIYPETWRS